MSESEKTTQSPVSGATVFLLLFIGFIFGVPTGFMAKDTVLRTYLKMFNNPKSAAQQDSDSLFPGNEGVTTIEEVVATGILEDNQANEQSGEKKEDEKKEDEKKE